MLVEVAADWGRRRRRATPKSGAAEQDGMLAPARLGRRESEKVCVAAARVVRVVVGAAIRSGLG